MALFPIKVIKRRWHMSAVRTILEIMSPEERQAVHSAAIDLLANSGMKIESLDMLKALGNSGCKINYESNMVLTEYSKYCNLF